MYGDRVLETSTSTGTGAITLSGVAPLGRQTFFARFGASPVSVAYCIEGVNLDGSQTGQWEVGTGTFDGSTGLTRTTILASSNAGALVNFTAGTKNVFCTAPAAYLLPPGANTQVAYNNAGIPGANANFTYNAATNTVTFGNITGSALAMTIQPRAPTVFEDVGILSLRGRNAVKANSGGGVIALIGGNATGTGTAGDVTLNGGNAVSGGIGGSINLTAGDGALFGGAFSALSGGTGSESGATFFMDGGQDGVAGGSFEMGAGYGGSAAGGSFIMFLAGGTTSDGYMEWQDSNGSPFMRFQSATPGGGAKQMGFFGATPVVQQTTSIASATRTAVGGAAVNTNDTFGGYTIGQIVTALKAYGLLV